MTTAARSVRRERNLMAKMEARILSVAVTCLLTTAAVWADEPRTSGDAGEAPTGLVGERVRLSGSPFATSDDPLIGQVVAVDAEAITVVKDKRSGETRRIPFSLIKRLDVARPERRSCAGTGAFIGIAIPAVAALLVAGMSSDGGGELSGLGQAVAVYYVAVVGIPAGALMGAAIGSQFHTEVDRWERAPAHRVRVSVLPDLHDGIRGGLTVRF
jgi:hypothetical protein